MHVPYEHILVLHWGHAIVGLDCHQKIMSRLLEPNTVCFTLLAWRRITHSFNQAQKNTNRCPDVQPLKLRESQSQKWEHASNGVNGQHEHTPEVLAHSHHPTSVYASSKTLIQYAAYNMYVIVRDAQLVFASNEHDLSKKRWATDEEQVQPSTCPASHVQAFPMLCL